MHPTRPIAIAFPFTRSLAFAALLSAPLAALPIMAAHAQTAAPKTAAADTATSEKAETVEQRITSLREALKIKPDQEKQWNDVAQAMRDNAANMQKLVAEKHRQAPQNMTAIDDLETYQKFSQAHVDGLKNLTSAFKSLYGKMDDGQKKNADQVFENFHREPASGRG